MCLPNTVKRPPPKCEMHKMPSYEEMHSMVIEYMKEIGKISYF